MAYRVRLAIIKLAMIGLAIVSAALLMLAPGPGVPPARAATLDKAVAQQAGPIQMQVEAGFGGRYREGRWMPVLIRVSNSGPGMSGVLRVLEDTGIRLTNGGFSTPIDLPNQSSKQVFLYVATEAFASQIRVDLVADNGILVASAVAPLTRISPTDALVGIVTEAPAGSLDFSAIRTYGAAVQTNLSLDNLPPLAQALEALDVLVFNDVDTGRLALDRRRAVEDWALSGGHLIVMGGPNWQKTRAGFDALLPFAGSGTVTLNSLDSLAAFVAAGDDRPKAVNVIAAGGTLRTDARGDSRVLVEQDGAPLIIRRTYGNGIVDYVTLDPNQEPLRSWASTRDVWGALVGTISTRAAWADGVADSTAAVRAINYVRGLRLPDAVQLAGFLFVYIILIGPLNYLILRRLRRLEWAWVTIPALIALTSVGAYFIGSNLRGTLPIVSRMNVVQQWPGEPNARLDGIVGVLAPRRSVYSVEAGAGVALRALSSDTAAGMMIEEGARYAANNIPVDSGISANFVTSAVIQPLLVTGTATITISRPGELEIQGEIRNNSPQTLSDAIVFCLNTPITLGELAPGETHPFRLTATIPELAIPSIASGPSAIAALYSRTYGIYRYSRELTAADLLTSGYQSVRAETTADQVEQRRRSFFASAMTSDLERGSGRGFGVYFAAWADGSPIEVNLRDTASNTDDLTLYIIGLTTRRGGTTQEVSLTPGQTMWMPLTRTILGEYSPYNLYVVGGNAAAFRFVPAPALRLGVVRNFTLTLRQNLNAAAGVVSVWDTQRGQWADLDPKDATQSQGRSAIQYVFDTPADLARYVGSDGSVRVQVRAPGSAVSYDSVEVTYTGALAS